jgi:hypothetical protein
MIRVTLQGRLGNWLFQYAAGRAVALRVGTELILDITELRRLRDPWAWRVRRLLRHFPLQARYDIRPLFSRKRPTFHGEDFGFDPAAVLTLKDGAWLDGFFQSPLYFADQSATLRAELTPQIESVRNRHPSVEREIADTNSVAVHVRRTDYVKKPVRNLCTTEYYERSMTLCREQLERPRFFIFSDDLDWCRENLRAPDARVVDTHAKPRAVYDLALMSRCRHHIIANSTFSWWSAWLAQTERHLVITPDRWILNDEWSAFAMRYTIPANWLRVQTQ